VPALSSAASTSDSTKVFCIGFPKTGTTSLGRALEELGYRLGDQRQGELLLPAYAAGDFDKIVDFCLTADAFQDAPFCYPLTYLALEEAYPSARFLLSVRDSAEQWYESLVRFHGDLFAGGRVPVKDDLVRATYCYPGFVWEAVCAVWKTPEDDVYNKPSLMAQYESHNAGVRNHFRIKTNFLELNLAGKGAYCKLCEFLGKEPAALDFPHLNVRRRG
jgi:hypothetical protein